MKKLFKFLIGLVILILLFVKLEGLKKELVDNPMVSISIVFQNDSSSVIQMFYNNGKPFLGNKSINKPYKGSVAFQTISFQLPKSDDLINLRFDLGSLGGRFLIKEVEFSDENMSISIPAKDFLGRLNEKNFIKSISYDSVQDVLDVQTISGDPYFSFFDVSKEFQPFTPDYRSSVLRLNLLYLVLIIILYFWIRSKGKISLKTLKIDFRTIFIMVFFLILLAPFVILKLRVFETNKNMENRFLTEFPVLRKSRYGDFLRTYAAYFKDHFGLRNQLISLNNLIHYEYLGETANPQIVQMGEDKWLYSTQYLNAVYATYLIPDQQLLIQNSIHEKAEYLNNLGIKYYLMVAPNKASAYRAHRPLFFKHKQAYPNISNMYKMFENDLLVNVIDIRHAIDSAVAISSVPLYYHTDTHWNSRGAKVAYNYLVKFLQKDFPSIPLRKDEEYTILKKETFEGDLVMNLAIGDIIPRENWEFTLNREDAEVETSKTTYGSSSNYYTSKFGDSLKVLVFHDSYGLNLNPFIQETFQQTIFLWTKEFRFDIIEKEMPDIVIQERMQTFITDFIDPNTPEFLERLEWSRTLNNSIPE